VASFSPQLCEGISINARLFCDRIVGLFLQQNHLAGRRPTVNNMRERDSFSNMETPEVLPVM